MAGTPLPDKFVIALPLHSDYAKCSSDGEYIYVNYKLFDDASTPDPLSNVRPRPFRALGGAIRIEGGGIKLPAEVKEEHGSSTYPCTKTAEEVVGFGPLKFKVKKRIKGKCTEETVKYVVSFSNKYLSVELSTKQRGLSGETKREYEADPIRFRKETLSDVWWISECSINGYWLFRAVKHVSPSGKFMRISAEPLAASEVNDVQPDYVLADIVIPSQRVNSNYYSVEVQLDGSDGPAEVFKVRHWWKYNCCQDKQRLHTFLGNYHILILARFGSRFFARAWFEDHYVFDYEIDASAIPPVITEK